jgi:hypothetical protein
MSEGAVHRLLPFGAVFTHLAQGYPFDAPKGNPEQAPALRGASKPAGRISHKLVKNAG